MKMKILSFLNAFVLFCFSSSASAQQQTHHQQTAKDVFTLKKLTDRVYFLKGRGGNVGFYIGKEAVLVVDSQYRDLAPGIVDKIKSVTDKPIKYLINTHYHPDHVGGNSHFMQFALIIAHDNVRKRVLASPAQILAEYPARLEEYRKKGDQDRVRMITEQIEWAKKVRVEEIGAPFLTFDSEFRIHLDIEDTIHLWHTPPAHTDGDSVVYFQNAKVIHMGDLFFHKVIPLIDVKGGGSAKGYLRAIDAVIARVPADSQVIPGHGEMTDIGGLRGFRQYITDLLELASTAKRAGKTKEQFVKEATLPAYKDYTGWEDRFKSNAEAAFDEVSKSPSN